MPSIDSITQASNTAINQTTGNKATQVYEDSKNQFLQLLITQLKNQDPFSPADSTQFAQQMMQMGQLEQLMNLNVGVEKMVAAQTGSAVTQYSGMVGKGVLANGNTFEISPTTPANLNFEVDSIPEKVTISIFDQTGNVVRSINTGITNSGKFSMVFDGLANNGSQLPNGYYNYNVNAIDSDGNPISGRTYSSGHLSSVRLENGSPVFQMGNSDLAITDIHKIF